MHGDIKTLNALYVEDSKTYKWCDFGFSKKIKAIQSLASAAATVAADTGTQFWMAPELFTHQVKRVASQICFCATHLMGSNANACFLGRAIESIRYVLFWRHFVGNFLRPHALRHACQIWDRIECHPAASSQRFAESSSPRPQPC